MSKEDELKKKLDDLGQELVRVKEQKKKIIEYNQGLLRDKKEKEEEVRKFEKEIKELRSYFKKAEELKERLGNSPLKYGIFVRPHPGGKPEEIDVFLDGNLHRVVVIADLLNNLNVFKCGYEVLINGNLQVVGTTGQYWKWGSEVIFKDWLGEDMVLVTDSYNGIQQCFVGPELRMAKIKEGDHLLNCSGVVVKILPKTEEREHFLDAEEVKDTDFTNIGGLSKQISEIEEALLPFVMRNVCNELKIDVPRGILLYGPPGCGKTMVARAIAFNLAKKRGIRGYFMNIVSTQLINKYVGETERKLREVFERAKEKAEGGNLVVIFMDEFDALVRSRDFALEHEPWKGDTIAQLCGILDGIQSLGDVILIGATNHKKLIDSAVLRPGRLSVQIFISRPTRDGAKEILRLYLTSNLPFAKKYSKKDSYEYVDHFGDGQRKIIELNKDSEKIREHFIDQVIKRLFYKGGPLKMSIGGKIADIDNRVMIRTLETIDESGYLKDFVSGAMLKNIVEKAKRIALQRFAAALKENPEAKIEITKKDFFEAVAVEHRNLATYKELKKTKRSGEKTIDGFKLPDGKTEDQE